MSKMALKSRKREYKPDLTVQEALLNTPNKPDPVRKRRIIKGRYTRKGLCEFFFELFETNEMLAPKLRRTNAAIVDLVCKEFPKRYDLHVRLRAGEKNGVNYYRQLYNTGRLVPGRTVKYVSFRYNEHGQKVDYATGKRLITATDQKEYLEKYQNKILALYHKSLKDQTGDKT